MYQSRTKRWPVVESAVPRPTPATAMPSGAGPGTVPNLARLNVDVRHLGDSVQLVAMRGGSPCAIAWTEWGTDIDAAWDALGAALKPIIASAAAVATQRAALAVRVSGGGE